MVIEAAHMVIAPAEMMISQAEIVMSPAKVMRSPAKKTIFASQNGGIHEKSRDARWIGRQPAIVGGYHGDIAITFWKSNVANKNPLEMGISIEKSPVNSVSSIATFDYWRVNMTIKQCS